MSMTGRHAIAQTNPCTILLGLYLGSGMHRTSDKHLACSDGMNLDYCKLTAITGYYGMTIITLDNLYFMLSYKPTPPNALSMSCERHADSSGTSSFFGPRLIQKWASRHPGPKLLVDLECACTCHVANPDPSASRSWTCPWDLVRGVYSTSFLEELCHTQILSQNRMLIVCVPRNQVYTHTIQKMDTK
jgi:hypothetical protein